MQPFSSVRTLTGVSDVMAAAVPADRLLADRVRRDGDEEAFRTLYRRHTPGLYRFVLRLLGGNEFDAEDIVQQAWLKAVEGLGDFRWEASFRTWLHGIALNCCRGLFRRKEPRWLALEEGPLLAGPMTNPDERIRPEAAPVRVPNGDRAA
jgi:RNA polymerase sigma-70 factor (ECF subfamily)